MTKVGDKSHFLISYLFGLLDHVHAQKMHVYVIYLDFLAKYNIIQFHTQIYDVQPKHTEVHPRTKKIAILGEMHILNEWVELSDMAACFIKDDNVFNDNRTTNRRCRQHCPKHDEYIELYLTRNLKDFDDKDAVVYGLSPFTLTGKNINKLIHYEPPPGQLMVLYSMETPIRFQKWIERIGRAPYHVDMAYMINSNISIPYAIYQPFQDQKRNKPNFYKNWATGKTGFIAWMGSNCKKEVFWPRMEFINQLQTFTSVDLYGKCGNLTCLPRLSEHCTKLMSKYKFYLAFENAECHDYITEKFWITSLLNDVVPVVYGAPKSDYEKYAPPNSFIHVSDFKDAKDLVDYLKVLNDDDALYNTYFDWRRTGEILVKYPNVQPSYFCAILDYLKPETFHNKTRLVSESAWFTSCRERILHRFDPHNVQKLNNWNPWEQRADEPQVRVP